MLSKKKEKAIKEIAGQAFLAVLEENHFGYEGHWWNDPPDTWSDQVREHFDALTSLQDKIVVGVLALLSKPSNPSKD